MIFAFGIILLLNSVYFHYLFQVIRFNQTMIISQEQTPLQLLNHSTLNVLSNHFIQI